MSKFQVLALAEALARALDKRIGFGLNVVLKCFERRKISLTDRGEVGEAEIQAALRAMGTCLPDKTSAWLSGKLLKIEGLDALADALWQLSLASIPVAKRKSTFYARHQPYQLLLGTLYEAFLWNLVTVRTGGQVTHLNALYRRLIFDCYSRLIDRFSVERPPSIPVDELINQAIEGFFQDESQEVTADPTMEFLMKELLPPESLFRGVSNDPASQGSDKVTADEFKSEIASLRAQIVRLKEDMHGVLKRMRSRHYISDEPVVSQDKWTAVQESPEHQSELAWLLSQIPTEEHEALLHEVALAVTQEKRMPDIERYREILSGILKKQKRLIC
ncbi:MAG: hypothetical protein ACYC44_00570 [Patescibacteria group bacterium]